MSTCNRRKPCKLEVWECVVGFAASSINYPNSPDWLRLVLRYPLSPVAALLGYVVIVLSSSYLAGVIACFSDEPLAPFRSEDIGRGKQQRIQERITSNIVEHLVSVTGEQSQRHQPASNSSRPLGPYCLTLKATLSLSDPLVPYSCKSTTLP